MITNEKIEIFNKEIIKNKNKYGYDFFRTKGKVEEEDLDWIKETWYTNFNVLRSVTEPVVHIPKNKVSFIDISETISQPEVNNWIDFLNYKKMTRWILENFNFWVRENSLGTNFKNEKKEIKMMFINNMFTAAQQAYTILKLFEIELKQAIFPVTLTWEIGLNNRLSVIPSFIDIDQNLNLAIDKNIITSVNKNDEHFNERLNIANHINAKIKNEQIFINLKEKKPDFFKKMLNEEKRARVSQNKIDLLSNKMKIIEETLKEEGLDVLFGSVEITNYDNGMIKLRNFISHGDGTIMNLFFKKEKYNELIVDSLKKIIDKKTFEIILRDFKKHIEDEEPNIKEDAKKLADEFWKEFIEEIYIN